LVANKVSLVEKSFSDSHA